MLFEYFNIKPVKNYYEVNQELKPTTFKPLGWGKLGF